MSALSLFDDEPTYAMHDAFQRWLSVQWAGGSLRQPSSVEVYSDMWGAFAAWCLAQSPALTPESLTVQDLEAFYAARLGRKSSDLTLSPRHALKLMRLIDRVLRHGASERDHAPNLAAADWLAANPQVRYADAATADPLPELLAASEAKHLITFLSEARPRLGKKGEALRAMAWQELRNRTAVALQLGAGLTPGDVRALAVDSPISRGSRVAKRPWKLAVPGAGSSGPRETPVAAWAGELLQHWMAAREQSAILGSCLFPSTKSGKPWGKESQYKCAKAVLEAAGIDSTEGGSFRLRHTFAMRQLRRGFEPETVAQWLGVEPSAMERYRRLVGAPIEVV